MGGWGKSKNRGETGERQGESQIKREEGGEGIGKKGKEKRRKKRGKRERKRKGKRRKDRGRWGLGE
jgi:hypothetical protein